MVAETRELVWINHLVRKLKLGKMTKWNLRVDIPLVRKTCGFYENLSVKEKAFHIAYPLLLCKISISTRS